MLPMQPRDHQAHLMPQGVDPCSHGQHYGAQFRRNIQQQVMATDPMDTMSSLPYAAGAGEPMMGALDSAGEGSRFQESFLRDASMGGDMPSPFLMDDGDSGIAMGGGMTDSMYMANDPMVEDQHRRVKLEMDVDHGMQAMGNVSGYHRFRPINYEPHVLQGQYSLPTKLYTPAEEISEAHAKRICIQDMQHSVNASGGRHSLAGYHLVRTGGPQNSGWTIQPTITQPMPLGKEGLQPSSCISRTSSPTPYMYMSPHGIMSPVTRRHSTGSANPSYTPCSSPTQTGPVMLPVQEHTVPVPVPVMGTGGSYRVNSDPMPYEGGHKISRLESSCLGSPGSLSRDQGFRDQSSREGGREESRVRRRVHKKRENLPKESTALLKDWLLSHMMLPYPGNEEKMALCKATNLDISQINNWFINARVRIWKPLVREVFDKYSERLLEQAQEDKDEHQAKRIQDAHKATTMNMITLLSGLQPARKELDDIANKSKSLVKEV